MNHLDEAEHKDALDEFNKKLVEDLKQLKQEEKEKGELQTERRRWFNKEIEKLEKQLQGGSQ